MSTYKLDISKKADNVIRNLQAKQFKQIYIAILDLLKNPRSHDARELMGYSDLLRKDIGEC